ncbi:sulfurtransferase [Shewanella algae]|uniref:sulfurtransferase n=1 Tax=Shewanella algae TaxID=38313 RepID=UPI000787F1A4|nr:sulfurtransferase [Shewanella algae]NKZ41098.1 sulfurtransferase [Shewanella algae]QTE79641.1 sulfurtransferase [Shewanella algae]
MQSALVSSEWLAAHLSDPKLVILDASMDKVIGREPIVYDEPCFIAGARRLDLERECTDLQSSELHALPSQAQFTELVQRLGIDQDSTVVIYDNQGIYSSPRGWWCFKVMGFEQVFVLDGGLPKWLKEQRSCADKPATEFPRGNACGQYQAEKVCNAPQVLDTLADKQAMILDARASSRFLGQSPEPREGVRNGHIPGAVNLPFAEVLDGDSLKPQPALEQTFLHLGAMDARRSGKPLIFSCGSGITACILILAAYQVRLDALILYDGSWADWGSKAHLPLATS